MKVNLIIFGQEEIFTDKMRQQLAEFERQRYLILTLVLSQIEKEVLLLPMLHLLKAANFCSSVFLQQRKLRN